MREILVPIDFSGPSQRACDFAVALASTYGAGLVLLRVVEPLPAYAADAATTDALMEAEARALADRAELLRPHTASLQTELVAGIAWQEIVRVAAERKVDLVVMGTHGRRGLARALLGSVAERVVRTCPVPVVTVPGWALPSRKAAASRLAERLAPLGLEAPLVVALSRPAVPIAVAMARALGGTSDVWLVAHVAVDGRIVGAVTEQGDATFDTAAPDRATEENRRVAVLAARRVLSEELLALRGGRSIGDVWRRDVVLVDDGAISPASILAAARSLYALLPKRIVAALPIAERDALAALDGKVDHLVVLEPVVGCDDRSSWYRDDVVPSPAEARAQIDAVEGPGVGSSSTR